jgi:hypothetical protein
MEFHRSSPPLVTHVGVLNWAGHTYRVLGGLPDDCSKSADRIGKHEELVSVEMQGHRTIGKVELPTFAEGQFRLFIPAHYLFHGSSLPFIDPMRDVIAHAYNLFRLTTADMPH